MSHNAPLTVPGGVLESLEVTIDVLDLKVTAAAHVASMRAVARKMDLTMDDDVMAKLANTLQRQLDFLLKNFVAAPDVGEDPWDMLARKLATDAAE